jgi:hypothetical protein
MGSIGEVPVMLRFEEIMIEEILRAGLLARRHTGDVSVMYRGHPELRTAAPRCPKPSSVLVFVAGA